MQIFFLTAKTQHLSLSLSQGGGVVFLLHAGGCWESCDWLGFLWRWGVFGSLAHLSRSGDGGGDGGGGGVPPRAACRWAHVWRNEPRAISRGVWPPPCVVFTSRLLSHLRPSLFPPFPSCICPPVALVSWGLPVCWLVGTRQELSSGSSYRKICPFPLQRAAVMDFTTAGETAANQEPGHTCRST